MKAIPNLLRLIWQLLPKIHLVSRNSCYPNCFLANILDIVGLYFNTPPLLTTSIIIFINIGFHSKSFLDEPTKPGTPEIVDYDNESVQLKWTKPESDGGAPIEKYIIEKKSKFQPEWEKAIEVPGDVLEGKVPDLKERVEYQFRVIAVNKAGPSPASDPTKNHLVKHRACKYKLMLIFYFRLLRRYETVT